MPPGPLPVSKVAASHYRVQRDSVGSAQAGLDGVNRGATEIEKSSHSAFPVGRASGVREVITSLLSLPLANGR